MRGPFRPIVDFSHCHKVLRAILVTALGGVAGGLPTHCLRGEEPVSVVAFAPTHDQALIASDRGLNLVDPETGRVVRRFDSRIRKPMAITFAPEGSSFAVAGGTPAERGMLEIFELGDETCRDRWSFDEDLATDVGWRSPTEWVVVTRSGDRFLIEVGNPEIERIARVHARGIRAVIVLDRERFVTAGADQMLRVATSKATERTLNNHLDAVNDLALRPAIPPDRRPEVASASDDGTVRLWQPDIGRMVRFIQLDSVPNCIAWNPEGTLIVAGCRDGQVRIIDPLLARVLQSWDAGVGWIHSLSLDPAGARLLVGGAEGWTFKPIPIEEHP